MYNPQECPEIYNLKPHEEYEYASGNWKMQILRVPGGWIYTQHFGPNTTSVFVRWNPEYKPMKGVGGVGGMGNV